MLEIDECRLAVASAYIWLSRLKSTDTEKMAKIRDIQVKMEEVWTEFNRVFP